MRALARDLKKRLFIVGGLLAVLWLVEIADALVWRGALDAGGIRPRTQPGLWGIVYAPFLHGGFGHLLANTVPLFVLGWLMLLRRLREFFLVTALVVLAGGLGVWLFGRPNSLHIGASGLIFGYLGYLLLRGYFERSLTAIALAVVAGALYGGALWGVLPSQPGVSWEGHLFGFGAGAGMAGLHPRRRPPLRTPVLTTAA